MTGELVPGAGAIEVLEVVEGSAVVAKAADGDTLANLKLTISGDLRGSSEMLDQARTAARARMVDAATSLGADAIVGMRYAMTAIAARASVVLCYGTAVKTSA